MTTNKNQSDSEQSVITTEPSPVQMSKPTRRWWHWHEPGASKEEKWLIFKLDAAILTYTCLTFFVKYLDQTNVTNAYVSGMKEDLDLLLGMHKAETAKTLYILRYRNVNGRLGLAAWRWLFILDFLISVPVVILGLIICPDEPKAKKLWWMSEDEKQRCIERMADEGRDAEGSWNLLAA
uniref:Uncharacterized protein n=1 Tax=Fusarium oxysporum (strain Fo5176) TaxID=660025 RepID=A0A0D2Y9Y8_FUSOF